MNIKTIILLLAFAFHATLLFGQDSLPSQMVVRLNFNYLKKDLVNDRTILRGKIENILNEDGKIVTSQIGESGFDIVQLSFTKMFPHLTTNDTLSISRLGKPIIMPPF